MNPVGIFTKTTTKTTHEVGINIAFDLDGNLIPVKISGVNYLMTNANIKESWYEGAKIPDPVLTLTLVPSKWGAKNGNPIEMKFLENQVEQYIGNQIGETAYNKEIFEVMFKEYFNQAIKLEMAVA